jgi:hypothetical protein
MSTPMRTIVSTSRALRIACGPGPAWSPGVIALLPFGSCAPGVTPDTETDVL